MTAWALNHCWFLHAACRIKTPVIFSIPLRDGQILGTLQTHVLVIFTSELNSESLLL